MQRELIEKLVETAMVLGVVNAQAQIGAINDAMDEIRRLEQVIRDNDITIKGLKQEIIRDRIRGYNKHIGSVCEHT